MRPRSTTRDAAHTKERENDRTGSNLMTSRNAWQREMEGPKKSAGTRISFHHPLLGAKYTFPQTRENSCAKLTDCATSSPRTTSLVGPTQAGDHRPWHARPMPDRVALALRDATSKGTYSRQHLRRPRHVRSAPACIYSRRPNFAPSPRFPNREPADVSGYPTTSWSPAGPAFSARTSANGWSRTATT